jgi:phage terminase large subunit GpA-like protein
MVQWPKGEPENGWMECLHCAAHWTDANRLSAVRSNKGEWRASAPFHGKRGYFLNGIYSPFPPQKGYKDRIHMMIAGFLDSKAGGREQLKTWVNTFLAQTWEEKGDTVDGQPLFNRRESYTPDTLPVDVLAVTAAVDVQANRLEFERVGWGDGLESWGIEYGVIFGNPKKTETWSELDRWILQPVKRVDGAVLPTACVCIDSGHLARETYKFTTPRQIRRVFAVKGSGIAGHTLVKKSQMKGQGQLTLFHIGTGEAKDDLFAGLGLQEPGPSYAHFPVDHGYDIHYFEMLTAEVCRSTYRNGQRVRKWELKAGVKRNESLDIRVYNRAAIHILNPNFERIRRNILKNLANSDKSIVAISESNNLDKKILKKQNTITGRRRGKSFAKNW